MANETVTIPENVRAKAKEKGWPDDLVQQALAAGATAEQLIGYMDQGVTAEQARQFLAAQAGGGAEPSDEIKAKAAAGRLAGGPRPAGAGRGRGRGRPDAASWTWASRPSRRASSWRRRRRRRRRST